MRALSFRCPGRYKLLRYVWFYSQARGILAILVIFQARLLPISTRYLATLVQYQSEAFFKTLSCSIYVHSVFVDQTLSMLVMLYSYCSVSQTTEHGGPIDGRHGTYVTSKYHSVNVLVSRPSLCVLLNKYMLLTHDKVCLFTADKCKTLHEVSYFDSVLYFCFSSFPVYAICLEIETNVSTDRAILNILRHHIENDVFTT